MTWTWSFYLKFGYFAPCDYSIALSVLLSRKSSISVISLSCMGMTVVRSFGYFFTFSILKRFTLSEQRFLIDLAIKLNTSLVSSECADILTRILATSLYSTYRSTSAYLCRLMPIRSIVLGCTGLARGYRIWTRPTLLKLVALLLCFDSDFIFN